MDVTVNGRIGYGQTLTIQSGDVSVEFSLSASEAREAAEALRSAAADLDGQDVVKDLEKANDRIEELESELKEAKE